MYIGLIKLAIGTKIIKFCPVARSVLKVKVKVAHLI